MSLNWLAFGPRPGLNTALSPFGYGIVLLYAILTALPVATDLDAFRRLDLRGWLKFAGLVIAGALLSRFAVVSGDIRGSLPPVSIPLFALVPALAAALWLGRSPAVVVGFATGLTWALYGSGRLTQPLEMAMLGAAFASMLNQRWRGTIGHWLRHPIVAVLLSGVALGWPLAMLGALGGSGGALLPALERTVAQITPLLMVMLVTSLLAGMLIEAIFWQRPEWRPVQPADLELSPWEYRLGQRLVYGFGPAAILVIALVIGVATATVYRVATRLVVEQMAREAVTAGAQIPFYVQMGRSLLYQMAINSEPDQLEQDVRAVPFFQQLIAFDRSGEPETSVPEGSLPIGLTEQEARRLDLALEQGLTTEVIVQQPGEVGSTMTFITPVEATNGRITGALLGRTTLNANPLLDPVIEVLRSGAGPSGEGFVIDAQNRILLHPSHPERQGQIFELTNLSPLSINGGQAYRQRQPDGTRQLVYVAPVADQSNWQIVMAVPNEVVLALSLQIALPTFLLALVIAGVLLPASVQLMRTITVPLEQLAESAAYIAEGDLSHSPGVTGQDEIGRLGDAFDLMRERLGQRLAELERLLNVARTVSSSLELFRAMPPILSSALDTGGATGVRIALERGEDEPLQVYTAGPMAPAMAVLDRQLVDLVAQQGTVVVSDISRTGGLDVTNLDPSIRALLAFPLRTDTTFFGVMWLAYDAKHQFEESEMNFIATLVGQAAISVANTRLFSEAEEGRRKLEAVLESTTDGIIVVDGEGRVVLVNPAAEDYLDIRLDRATGRRVTEVIDLPELTSLMVTMQEPVSVLELPHGQGETLLANTSTIVGRDGTLSGRVTVLRDITALKELDNIKTVFLRLVSHDLRSPLTYMNGYLSMLPMFGNLNEKQQEAVQRVSAGIEDIKQMAERLSYMSKFQLGESVTLERTLVNVEELLYQVYATYETFAEQRQIDCKIQVLGNVPPLYVDSVLYKQALANLLHNALKYTPEGGHVVIRAEQSDDNMVTVTVADDGIGIREEDQAQLFTPFYRVPQHADDPPRPKGSGLGLALIKSAATAHGGTVSVRSAYGHGSAFSVSVPVVEPPGG